MSRYQSDEDRVGEKCFPRNDPFGHGEGICEDLRETERIKGVGE